MGLRLGVASGRAGLRGSVRVALDLIVGRLGDMARGQIVVLDRAVAGDLCRTIRAFRQLEARRGYRNRPGVGGADACGAGALQAPSAKPATSSGAIVFMASWLLTSDSRPASKDSERLTVKIPRPRHISESADRPSEGLLLTMTKRGKAELDIAAGRFSYTIGAMRPPPLRDPGGNNFLGG
jgi:hypothetical protein